MSQDYRIFMILIMNIFFSQAPLPLTKGKGPGKGVSPRGMENQPPCVWTKVVLLYRYSTFSLCFISSFAMRSSMSFTSPSG